MIIGLLLSVLLIHSGIHICCICVKTAEKGRCKFYKFLRVIRGQIFTDVIIKGGGSVTGIPQIIAVQVSLQIIVGGADIISFSFGAFSFQGYLALLHYLVSPVGHINPTEAVYVFGILQFPGCKKSPPHSLFIGLLAVLLGFPEGNDILRALHPFQSC